MIIFFTHFSPACPFDQKQLKEPLMVSKLFKFIFPLPFQNHSLFRVEKYIQWSFNE